MSILKQGAGAAAVLLALALAACGRASGPDDVGAEAPGEQRNRVANDSRPHDAPMSHSYAPPTATPDPADSGGPRNSFIVCPGNPRCPPPGSQPRRGPEQ